AENQPVTFGMEGSIGGAGAGQFQYAEALAGDFAGRFEGQYQRPPVVVACYQSCTVKQCIGRTGAGGVEGEGAGKSPLLAQLLGESIKHRGQLVAGCFAGPYPRFDGGDIQGGGCQDQQAGVQRARLGAGNQLMQTLAQLQRSTGYGQVGALLMALMQREPFRLRQAALMAGAGGVLQGFAQRAAQLRALQIDRLHEFCLINAAMLSMLLRMRRPSLAPSIRTP